MNDSMLRRAIGVIGRRTPQLMRISLAVVFIWFGLLKMLEVSPVAALAAGSIPGPVSSEFVPLLGGFEVALGLGLLVGRHPLVITGIVAHLAGTFLVLFTQPDVAFQESNPLLLTTEGEFVVKNLVLLAAALSLLRWSHPHPTGIEEQLRGAD